MPAGDGLKARYQKAYYATGQVGQGRRRALPIQQVALLTLLRYIERNPLRAGLVPGAED